LISLVHYQEVKRKGLQLLKTKQPTNRFQEKACSLRYRGCARQRASHSPGGVAAGPHSETVSSRRWDGCSLGPIQYVHCSISLNARLTPGVKTPILPTEKRIDLDAIPVTNRSIHHKDPIRDYSVIPNETLLVRNRNATLITTTVRWARSSHLQYDHWT
jgi:hypothetical protein